MTQVPFSSTANSDRLSVPWPPPYNLHYPEAYDKIGGVKLLSSSTSTKILSKCEILEEFHLLEKEKHKLGLKWENHHQLIGKNI